MYPRYPDTPEGRAREVLEHPEGEEYPGQFDAYKEILIAAGWDPAEVTRRYGPLWKDRTGE